MGIVCLVTGVTRCIGYLFAYTFFMAGDTGDICVFASQLKICILIMIEVDLVPSGCRMTLLTFLAVPVFMDVIQSMAINAFCAGFVSVYVIGVAGFTVQVSMGAVENKIRFFIMNKIDFIPAIVVVTGIAVVFQ